MAEYGRIHEDDMLHLYKSYQYGRRRLKSLLDEKYIREVEAIVQKDGAKDGVKKTVKVKNFSMLQLTSKGKALVEADGVKVSSPATTRLVAMEKQKKQTRAAVMLSKNGIEILEANYSNGEYSTWFEQSSIVKKHSAALNNHSRILGIIYSPGGDYGIYNVGDGTGKWYMSEEGSLLNVERYGRNINKTIVLVKGDKAQSNFEEIITEIDKRTKDRTYNIPQGIKTLSILNDSEVGYEMIKNMTQKDWKLKIAKYALRKGIIDEATARFADYRYDNKHVVIMVHNCIVARENIKAYQVLMADTRTQGKDVLIICLKSQLEYFGKELPYTYKVAIKDEMINSICRESI